ncbi:MAG: thioredoxin domain-containing protein [Gammaproteobacteria bacterium]|nr:thioredoxin domain-containing protein [Gammaproteobacteria bacterium]MBU1443302.1 thioredoxin domain-containing protein [Gammaproteobacteria bacterium]MBU2284924.1 thioredoxin domain-containing protein [Gammaproteobacteria bacterium]MBU2409266.1 thioredoxin domain-containing protein [Gammaproteobacteria bacterium]
MKRFVWVIGTAALAAGAFVAAAIIFSGKKQVEAVDLASKNTEALIRAHAPVYGNATAKVTIVEFFDPACETCRAFYPFVKSMVTSSFGQVNLVVRYAPFHQGSDQAVKILEAARVQDKYWQAMEAVLASQPTWASHHAPQPDLIWTHLEATGLDIPKAKADMNDPRLNTLLSQDLKDAETLGVTRTPGFFVNGRPLLDFGADQLKTLVDQEVRRAYGRG